MSFFGSLARGFSKVIGKVAPVVKKVGSFIAKNHHHIAPLAHGIAMASGNETAQKITGAGLALSKMATLGTQNNAFRDGMRDVVNYAKTQYQPPPTT